MYTNKTVDIGFKYNYICFEYNIYNMTIQNKNILIRYESKNRYKIKIHKNKVDLFKLDKEDMIWNKFEEYNITNNTSIEEIMEESKNLINLWDNENPKYIESVISLDY